MKGRIIRGIAGFYYVSVEDGREYECKAKGIFRNQKRKPLVGDIVAIEILDEEKRLGSVVDIMERRSELVRPAVANVDQAVVVFAAAAPEPNLNLLDRFLVLMARQNLPVIICFNKTDLIGEAGEQKLKSIYRGSGCELLFLCASKGEGIAELKERLLNKTTVLAGPSGVGKSTIMNLLAPGAKMETGEISAKISRGRHTTRHSELAELSKGTFLFDTPGFSSLSVEDMEKEELKNYFAEFDAFEKDCRFLGCVHLNEPGCAVKEALAKGEISSVRYENYRQIYEELKTRKKY